MPHRILIAIGTAATATVASGCFGSGAAPAPEQHRPATHVVVSYGAEGSLVHRRLRCGPAAGDYRDPAAACAALQDFGRTVRSPRRTACACILRPSVPGSVVGELDGHRVYLPLDASDSRTERDVSVLTSTP